MKTTDNIGVNREVKDSVLRLLLEDKKRALEVFNALNGTTYDNVDDLTITTLEDVIYMKMKNDTSLLLKGNMQLYEHQSTYNPNMPIRGLLYLADLYRQYLKDKHQYSTKLIKLPSPKYIVLYNGDRPVKEQEWMKLSDAFVNGNEHSQMELCVQMFDINYGRNKELLSASNTLREYAIFVDKIKKYKKTMIFEQAVDQAVTECIEENILREFLSTRRAEVMSSFLTEYDEERVIEDIGQERYEDGLEEGIEKGIEAFILDNLEEGICETRIREKLQKRFELSSEQADMYLEKYIK